ncbi:unnamed protein product [Aphanomyces euteiches]|uniref:SET domain-containing protein n=1 Tax=Aphanomyces euteiches TaxID=100861 RepID=A0A6G0WIR2_9STRA|nr:hypothetical protein Ae201684_014821 [Aphanomyces euteiches]KAH9072609.1 hypothetical protein Ae201684P_015684 [Aphanomyces euteiches]KAH9150093.1 hypothetical protein AeRB84_007004 [Aphanomyces euteiches]
MLPGVPVLSQAAVQVAQDTAKGRYVIATRPHQPGEIVFQDEAFVFASCKAESFLKSKQATFAQLLDSNESANDFHPNMHNLFFNLLSTMRGLDMIGEVDRAKCILKSVTKFLQNPSSLDNMLSLSYANEAACLDTAQQLIKRFPAVFTQVTAPTLAKIIGVLSTNSHELETLGGTGLFLSACLMEHNCYANCSFTTFESTLWVTAIRPIQVNEPLSIDYGNMFYRPLQERQEHMQQGYGFTCVCRACTEFPDKTRAYQCRLNGCTGLVHPFPTKPIETYRCLVCHQAWSIAQVKAIKTMEQELKANLPTTYRDILRIEASTPFHRFHYLLFWALDNLGLKGAQGLNHDIETLGAMWSDLISAIEYVVPEAHHEKTIYYDELAQVQIITGDIPGAVEAYGVAYGISCVVSGASTPPTLALKDLMDNPPKDRNELLLRYGTSVATADDAMEE